MQHNFTTITFASKFSCINIMPLVENNYKSSGRVGHEESASRESHGPYLAWHLDFFEMLLSFEHCFAIEKLVLSNC